MTTPLVCNSIAPQRSWGTGLSPDAHWLSNGAAISIKWARFDWRPRSAKYSVKVMHELFSASLMPVNSIARIPIVSVSLRNWPVPTIDRVYRENLRLLIKESGTLAAFAESIGKSSAQVSQWVNASVDPKSKKPRVLSRQSAREIEKKKGKPEGWMDQDHSLPVAEAPQPAKGSIYDALTEEEHEMLLNYRQVTDKDRQRLAGELSARAEELREYLAKNVPAHLPVFAQAPARRAAKVATSVVETARRRRSDAAPSPDVSPDTPELPFDE